MNADFVLLNGRIATMDAAGTEAQALAAFGGRIVAIGSDAAIRDHAGPATRILDAEGRRVIPGIVDSHAHPDAYAVRLRSWTLVSPDRVRSREELLGAIRRVCEALAPGRWGAFYRLNERASGGYPTLDELDAARKKADIGMELAGLPLGLASEGPSAPTRCLA